MIAFMFASAFAAVPADHHVGFGVGVTAPTGTFAPNTVSVRVRASDTLVLEPSFDVSFATSGSGVEAGPVDVTQRTSSLSTGVALGVRYHAASREKLALVVSGAPYANSSRSVNDPDVDTNDDQTVSSSLAVGVLWGLGAEFHPGGPWALSADAYNPLLSISRTSTLSPGDVQSVNSGLDVGLTFAPTVRVMGHLFF
jgi:hypothetical protein